MTKSYLILDEYMRFLDREKGRAPSKPIVEMVFKRPWKALGAKWALRLEERLVHKPDRRDMH